MLCARAGREGGLCSPHGHLPPPQYHHSGMGLGICTPWGERMGGGLPKGFGPELEGRSRWQDSMKSSMEMRPTRAPSMAMSKNTIGLLGARGPRSGDGGSGSERNDGLGLEDTTPQSLNPRAATPLPSLTSPFREGGGSDWRPGFSSIQLR